MIISEAVAFGLMAPIEQARAPPASDNVQKVFDQWAYKAVNLTDLMNYNNIWNSYIWTISRIKSQWTASQNSICSQLNFADIMCTPHRLFTELIGQKWLSTCQDFQLSRSRQKISFDARF